MGDENPIRTLGDYSKPSHEGYRNTIELPTGNNVVPLRSDTIRLVQNGCSFHRLRSEDPNQHLKDFLKLVDSLDLDGPSPQPQALGTTFEARQREEINDRMTKMFRLLKELMTSRTPKKVLIREETKFPVTKNVNSISLARNEEEENNKTDETPDNTKMPTEMEMPVRKAEPMNGAENGAENELIKTHENDEEVDVPGSQPVTGPIYDAIFKKNITKKEEIGGNFKIPCSIGGLKHANAFVDQVSNVNVMPYSNYMKLTDERPAETDIRLSLASHSYIYPLGIVEDVLVEVAEHVYPVDFMILDIKENEKRPVILGTPFRTIAKVTIRFDKGTITLRSGKSKVSFHRIPDLLCMTDKGVKNYIEPIAPTMTVNRLVLEWEEKIKLHLEKEIKFNQWRSKNFKGKHPTLIATKEGIDDEGEVTNALGYSTFRCYPNLEVLQIGIRAKVKKNQAHDPDYVPEPIYPEYIPLEDDHEFLAEEQPLHHVDSPTAESPGYVTESDPEEDPEEYEDDETEDGAVDYPMDGGDDRDDDDGDSSGDDADDEDEDDKDEEGEEELPYPSPPISLSPPFAGERLARYTALPAHSSPLPMPSLLLPSSGCPIQIQTLRIASTQALINAVTAALPSPPPLPPSLYTPPPVDRRDDIPDSEQPPRKRLCLSTLGLRYEVGESSTARPTRGQGIDYGFISTVDAEERRQGIRDVGYDIRDTWVDPAEAVPEMTPITMEEVNTRVIELAELYEHDTQDLYALLKDAQDSRSRISQ
ncbi:MAK10-like protein [Tanacetum coccineum]